MTWEFFAEVHDDMDPVFMQRLIALRRYCDFPFPVTSSLRPIVDKFSAHGLGRAVDIHIYGERAFLLIDKAYKYSFSGIGSRQHGPYLERFIHLDNIRKDEFPDVPRPRVWTYDRK